MQITLHPRTESHVRTYFERTQKETIRRMIPSASATVEQALMLFGRSQQPGATSFGRTVYLDGAYVGDVWCFGMDSQDTPQAMLSYCLFEEACWGKGAAKVAVRLFLGELQERFGLTCIGAHTWADNAASCRVLEKCGFTLAEECMDEGRAWRYYQRG